MMKKISWPVLACMVFFLSHAAMAGMYRDFGYDRPEQTVEAGSIGAVLSGTYSKDEGDSIHGRPYHLLVTLTLKERQMEAGCAVSLQSLSLLTAKGEEVFSAGAKPGHFGRELPGNPNASYVADFFFGDIDVPYEDYQLDVAILLKGCPSKNAGEQVQKAKLAFKMHYEEKEMSVWDALMGI